jgi:MFS family permease
MTANRWLVLVVLFLARTALGYTYQSVASVSPLMVADLSLSFAEVGALIGFFGLPGMFVALPGGLLGKRFGDVKVAVGGLALMALGGFLMAAADGYSLASAGRLFTGIGAVTMTVVLVKLVGDWFEGREVVTALAILMNSWPVGIALGQVTQGALGEAYGWQAAFAAAGAFSLSGALLIAVVFRRGTRDDGPAAVAGDRIAAGEIVLAALAGSVWTLYNGGFIVVMGFAPAMLTAAGLDVAHAGVLISTGTWVYMVAIPLGGWLSERLGRPNLVMLTCFAAGAGTVAAVPYVADPVICFVLAGIFIGVPTGNVMALTVECVRRQHRNTGNGVYYTVHYAGMFVIPAAAGWALDLSGTAAAAMLVGASATALAIVALLALRLLQARFAAGLALGRAA